MAKKKTPVLQQAGTLRDEWLSLMTELARLDRDEYRKLRSEAWTRIAEKHIAKSAKQLAEWRLRAS